MTIDDSNLHRIAVLFDLDGTLVDTAPDFVLCLNLLRARYKLPPLPDFRIRAQVSEGASALVRLGFNRTPDEPEFEPLRHEFLHLYGSHVGTRSRLFAGLAELLDQLDSQQLPWGIVTNKPRRFAEQVLLRLNLDIRCGVLVCPEDVEQTKPHPEPLLLACQTLDAQAANSIYIGDHIRDIEAGRNAGMSTVAAHYGYIHPHSPVEDWAADSVAYQPTDLWPHIEQHRDYIQSTCQQ